MQGPSAATMLPAPRAEPLHRRDRRFDHSRQRPFPSRMRRSDDPRALVGEKDHAAVSARHAERQARGRGHQRVAPRPRAPSAKAPL